jgi:hypothetical protein
MQQQRQLQLPLLLRDQLRYNLYFGEAFTSAFGLETILDGLIRMLFSF